MITIVSVGIAALIAVGSALRLNSRVDPMMCAAIDTPARLHTSESIKPPTRDDRRPTFDAHVFSARLWNPPPPTASEEVPGTATPAQRVIPPPQVELIAITTNGAEHIAAVFDRQRDELRLLRTGDTIHGFTIETIDATAVLMISSRPSASAAEETTSNISHRLALVTRESN